jgi:hypothetical protein
MRERVIHIIRESQSPRGSLVTESAPLSRLPILMESEEGKTQVKKSLMAKLRDSSLVDAGLDILSGIGVSLETGGLAASATGIGAIGGVPVATVGAATSLIADAINALRHALRGDYFSAVLYLLFAVPGAGDILQGVSWLSSGAKLTVKSIVELYPKLRKLAQTGKLKRVAEAAYKLLDMGIDKVPGLGKHSTPLRGTLKAVLDGDPAEIAKAAKQSGYDIAEAELRAVAEKATGEKETREKSEKMSESKTARGTRVRKVADLYKGVLY